MLILETLATAAKARLLAAALAGGNVDLHRDPPSTDDRLPLANVTYETDRAAADGDPRTGTADFVHTMTLVVDIVDTGATGAALMAKLAAHGEKVMLALIADLSWGGDVLEGVHSVRQLTEKSPEGARIVYRRQIQIDLLYRSQWEPDASGLSDFDTAHIDAGDGIGADVDVPT